MKNMNEVTGLDLLDSDTTATVGRATMAQVLESAMAGPEGHIKVDGRRVYVQAGPREMAECIGVAGLRAGATEAGDLDMVAICDRAVKGDERAVREVARAIRDGQAQS